MEKQSSTPYITCDLHEAAAIHTALGVLPGLRPSGHNVQFVFADGVAARVVSESYWRGQLEVDARRFVRGLQELKDLLFSQIRRDRDDITPRRARS